MLKDRVVVITGAGRGLGKEIALAFAREKSRLVLVSRTEPELKGVAQKAQEVGAEAEIYPADVAVESTIKEVIKQVENDFGSIDILINNAGVWYQGPAQDTPSEKIDELLAINLKGVMFTTQAVLPGMLNQGSGQIINISSTSGRRGKAKQTLYCATKFAVRGYTEALKQELAGTGVRVTGFYPGGMRTTLFRKSQAVDTSTFMNPKEIAKLVVTMASLPVEMVVSEIVIERTQY
jgi:NADP-dependent 3-hydroxy acid dehydrogenase YdfG